MAAPAHPSTRTPPQDICEAATRKWALVAVGIVVALVVSGAAIPALQETGGLAAFFFFAGVLAYWFCHVQLYRAVRDDIVMAPEKNAYFIRILRWYGPAAAVEVLFFVLFSRPGHSWGGSRASAAIHRRLTPHCSGLACARR